MRGYTTVYQTNIKSKENTMGNIRINYLSFETEIREASTAELAGWWKIALDYKSLAVKHEGFTVKQYSELAGAIAKDYQATTIAMNIGHCLWGMEQGWTLTSKGVKDGNGAIVKAMYHLRKTKNPPKTAGKATTKRDSREELLANAKNRSRETRQWLVQELLKTL